MSMMENVWHDFIAEDSQTRSLTLPEKVKDSWIFCKENEVSPYVCKIKIESRKNFEHRIKQNAELIELVQSELKNWESLFRAIRPVFVLTNMDGCILWRDGYTDTKEKAKNMDFAEGSYWTEMDVGTNAIALAIRKQQAMAVYNYEHYNVDSHAWNCWASMIYGKDKEPIGVLDVSSFVWTEEKDLIINMIQLITSKISAVIENRETQKRLQLLEYFIPQKNAGIVCDRQNQIIKVTDQTGLNEEDLLGKAIQEVDLPKGCILRGKQIFSNAEVIGYYYTLIQADPEKKFHFLGAASHSPNYQAFLNQVQKAAQSRLPVHLYGETGTGKELIAKTIHQNSSVSEGPLISINCGSLSESLLESELFGYSSGAFTGAKKGGYEGKIRQADGGTLFLDEVDSMSKRMQSTLLRVLEEKKVYPIGCEKEYAVDFRLITASNKELKKCVQAEQFRADLFYRIYVCKLAVPPLRERKEDIAELIRYYANDKQWHPDWLSKIAVLARKSNWYGNIRELNNFLERLWIFYPMDEPTEAEIQQLIADGQIAEIPQNKQSDMLINNRKNEREQILAELERQHYQITKTAKALAISRSTLYRKMKEYQIG